MVGNKVLIEMPSGPIEGTVFEDCGPLARDNSHIYGIVLHHDPYEDTITQLPENHIVMAGEEVPPLEPITNAEAFDYLLGTFQIMLYAGYDEHRYARVWLKRGYSHNGMLTHTYFPERGMLGGGGVPYDVLWNNKLKQTRLDEVRTFLKTFELTDEQVETIITKIGISKKK